MGSIFVLDNQISSPTRQLMDDMINSFSKNCRVVYPPIVTSCPNCQAAPPIDNTINSTWLTGGSVMNPIAGICSVCGGKGISQQNSDIITGAIYWNPKHFGNLKIDNLRLAKGLLKFDGFLTDLPKIQKCEYLIPDTDNEAYIHYRFRLCEEPISSNNIIKGRYFSSLWERIQ